MQRFYDVVLDRFGNPAAGVQVTVYEAGTTTPASLWLSSDNALDASNAVPNPFTTGADGIAAFAARNGRYTVIYSGSNITPRQLNWVTLMDGTGGYVATGTLAQFDPTTSAQLATVLTDETGTGLVVYNDTPTLLTPDVTGGTFTSPSLVTPTLGVATATSINGSTIPTSKTLVVTTDKLSALAATTSLELKGVISDETGSGALVFADTPTLVTPVLGSPLADIITFNKASAAGGIKVDTATPTWPWADLIGPVIVDAAGANAPTLGAFIGGSVRRWAFSAGDKADCEFHIPHDYLPGSDMYIHVHWAHNGTTISGNFVGTFVYTYAKGHNQAVFGAEKTVSVSYATVNIATTPRYQHRIEETQLSINGGSATLLDSSLIEVDGVIGVNYTQTTIPTITGGTPNEPFVFFIDIHYQSTGIGTKQRAPNFYV